MQQPYAPACSLLPAYSCFIKCIRCCALLHVQDKVNSERKMEMVYVHTKYILNKKLQCFISFPHLIPNSTCCTVFVFIMFVFSQQ